nr:RecName: Full=Odorant-binding protein 2; AltName: Full=Odorant-binding protein II; Short=OBP II; AltName: Full=Olfactory mucosa pyrazine-binding protein II [Hystrix cristata]
EHIDYSQVSGDWHSLSIAADSMDKIRENGELRMHLNHL